MIKRKLIALLRRAKPEAFSLFPFALEREGGKFQVCGYQAPSAQSLYQDELEELFREGYATKIEPIEIKLPEYFESERWVAGWIGSRFLLRVHFLGAPTPNVPFTRERYEVGQNGMVWLAPHEEVFCSLRDWLRQAAAFAFCHPNKARAFDIAKLMRWTLPDEPETRAAMWYVQKDDKAKISKLKWYTKLENDNNNPVQVQDLQREFEELQREYLGKEKLAGLLRGDILGWNAWREEHPDWVPDLQGCSFVQADLTKANLSHIGLEKADFTRAILTGANLTSARLDGALFTEANLIRANLSHTTPKDTDFIGAILLRAQLIGARFIRADFTAANLTGASLRGTEFLSSRLSCTSFLDVDFFEGSLVGCAVNKADFTGAKLEKIHIDESMDLTESNLQLVLKRDAEQGAKTRQDPLQSTPIYDA